MVDNIQAALELIRDLVWGEDPSSQTFSRWSDGFAFSTHETSALIQSAGGPCAILAPIQAYMLKDIIQNNPPDVFPELTVLDQNRILAKAMAEILLRVSKEGANVIIVNFKSARQHNYLSKPPVSASVKPNNVDQVASIAGPPTVPENPEPVITPAPTASTSSNSGPSRSLSNSPTESCEEDCMDVFHSKLDPVLFPDHAAVEPFLCQNMEIFRKDYGILLFLYSVLMTKGVIDLQNEIGDQILAEPLIHFTHGHGSQALVNLMLTGRAVMYVWDHDKDVCGLKFQGIDKQSDIGFMTIMETLRFCTVGTYLKNPKFPIWVLGSETHLTVAFSFESRLALPEQPWEKAVRLFRSYDQEGNNFISIDDLPSLLDSLGLVCEREYVDVMRVRLDKEGFGIVLLSVFMEEFFPKTKPSEPDTFTIWHYNGLAGSNANNMVTYKKGYAVLLDSDLNSECDYDQILSCLQTKWHNIEIAWETPNKKAPSLN